MILKPENRCLPFTDYVCANFVLQPFRFVHFFHFVISIKNHALINNFDSITTMLSVHLKNKFHEIPYNFNLLLSIKFLNK